MQRFSKFDEKIFRSCFYGINKVSLRCHNKGFEVEFLDIIKQAALLARERGLELSFTVKPIEMNNGSPNFPESPVARKEIAVDALPLVSDAIDRSGITKENATLDVVFQIFETIRLNENLLGSYNELRSRFGARVLHTSIARMVADALGLHGRGSRVFVENPESLINSYTQLK